jgi:hypothetical protein
MRGLVGQSCIGSVGDLQEDGEPSDPATKVVQIVKELQPDYIDLARKSIVSPLI